MAIIDGISVSYKFEKAAGPPPTIGLVWDHEFGYEDKSARQAIASLSVNDLNKHQIYEIGDPGQEYGTISSDKPTRLTVNAKSPISYDEVSLRVRVDPRMVTHIIDLGDAPPKSMVPKKNRADKPPEPIVIIGEACVVNNSGKAPAPPTPTASAPVPTAQPSAGVSAALSALALPQTATVSPPAPAPTPTPPPPPAPPPPAPAPPPPPTVKQSNRALYILSGIIALGLAAVAYFYNEGTSIDSPPAPDASAAPSDTEDASLRHVCTSDQPESIGGQRSAITDEMLTGEIATLFNNLQTTRGIKTLRARNGDQNFVFLSLDSSKPLTENIQKITIGPQDGDRKIVKGSFMGTDGKTYDTYYIRMTLELKDGKRIVFSNTCTTGNLTGQLFEAINAPGETSAAPRGVALTP